MIDRPLRAVFFDRDGVLNQDSGYVFRPEQFAWIPGAISAIQWLNSCGVLVLVVTNQSGVARGLYTLEDVDALMRTMQSELELFGANMDRWYVCPHHPSEGTGPLTQVCSCRKPEPGMVLQGLHDFGLEPKECILIGDKPRDIEAGQRAGVESFLFEDGDLFEFLEGLVEGRIETSVGENMRP